MHRTPLCASVCGGASVGCAGDHLLRPGGTFDWAAGMTSGYMLQDNIDMHDTYTVISS